MTVVSASSYQIVFIYRHTTFASYSATRRMNLIRIISCVTSLLVSACLVNPIHDSLRVGKEGWRRLLRKGTGFVSSSYLVWCSAYELSVLSLWSSIFSLFQTSAPPKYNSIGLNHTMPCNSCNPRSCVPPPSISDNLEGRRAIRRRFELNCWLF